MVVVTTSRRLSVRPVVPQLCPRSLFVGAGAAIPVRVKLRPFAFRRGRSDGRVHRLFGFRVRATGSDAGNAITAPDTGGRNVRATAGPVRQEGAECVLLRPDDVRPTRTLRGQLHGNRAVHETEHGRVP